MSPSRTLRAVRPPPTVNPPCFAAQKGIGGPYSSAVLGHVSQAISRRSEVKVVHDRCVCISVCDEQVPARQDCARQVELDSAAVSLADRQSMVTVVGEKRICCCDVLFCKVVIGQSPEEASS